MTFIQNKNLPFCELKRSKYLLWKIYNFIRLKRRKFTTKIKTKRTNIS